jgi:hypothetical protein
MIAKLQNVARFYEGWRFMHGLPEVDIWTGRAPILPAKT